jgi:Shikimate 5-dehydrogenase
LEQAEYRGAITIDGLGMLVHQAAPAFEAFYGQPPSNPDTNLAAFVGEFSS